MAVASTSIPILGICVGLQVMGASSEESVERVPGLRVTLDVVEALRNEDQLHSQNVGWDEVLFTSSILGFSASDRVDFYFDHGYALPAHGDYVAATSGYGKGFCAILNRDATFGVQFHPERSGEAGMALLDSFVRFEGG